MNTQAIPAPYARYPAWNTDFLIAWHAGRPWIAVEQLCEELGIDVATQSRRLRRHEATTGLPLQLGQTDDVTHLLMPFEELGWFLRTLRPKTTEAQKTLQRWRGTLFWELLDRIVADRGHYSTRTALRDAKRDAGRGSKPSRPRIGSDRPIPPPPRPPSRVTPKLIAYMREMQEKGYSLSQIGKETGYSKPTVSLCVRGLYPCVSPDAEEHAPSSPGASDVPPTPSAPARNENSALENV